MTNNKYVTTYTHTHTISYYLSIHGQMRLGDVCEEGDHPSVSLLSSECQLALISSIRQRQMR